MKNWILALILCGPALAVTDSAEWADSGITGPKYEEILKQMAALQAEYPDLTETVDYGVAPKGRTMRMLVAKKAGFFLQRTAVLMSGSTHGNEYLNIEDRLPKELLKKSTAGPVERYLSKGGVFLFVPILNPDGYDTRRRENSNGKDLNRDWDVPSAGFHAFTEVETKLLSEAIETLKVKHNLKLDLTVDYHCCIGAVLHPWSYTQKPIPQEALDRHVAFADLGLKALGNSIDVGTTFGILGYYAMGTTKDYYYDRHGAIAFTYEGRYGAENKYLDGHVAWWEEMLTAIVGRERLVLR